MDLSFIHFQNDNGDTQCEVQIEFSGPGFTEHQVNIL